MPAIGAEVGDPAALDSSDHRSIERVALAWEAAFLGASAPLMFVCVSAFHFDRADSIHVRVEVSLEVSAAANGRG